MVGVFGAAVAAAAFREAAGAGEPQAGFTLLCFLLVIELICSIARRWSRRPARASCAEKAASLLVPIQLFLKNMVLPPVPRAERFPKTLFAEQLAEFCLPHCCQNFPDVVKRKLTVFRKTRATV